MPKINEIHDNEITLELFRAGLLTREEFTRGSTDEMGRAVAVYRAGMAHGGGEEAVSRIEALEDERDDMERERDDAQKSAGRNAAALLDLARLVRAFAGDLTGGACTPADLLVKLATLTEACEK